MDLTNKEEREVFAKIANIDYTKVTRVYSGRPGCGCGCRGKYYDDTRNIKRIVKAMYNNLSDATRIDYDNELAAVETDTRYYWAYF